MTTPIAKPIDAMAVSAARVLLPQRINLLLL